MTAPDDVEELRAAVHRELAAIPAAAARSVDVVIEPATRTRTIHVPVPFLGKDLALIRETRSGLVAATSRTGGGVRITVGEEAARTYSATQLRGVLAHEIAHVDLGHFKGAAHGAVSVLHHPEVALCGAPLGLYLMWRGWIGTGLLVCATLLLAWLVAVVMSQRREHAADALAVAWTGTCMLDAVTRIQERQEPRMQRLHLHSHPPYQQRITRIQKALQARPARERNP